MELNSEEEQINKDVKVKKVQYKSNFGKSAEDT